MDFKQHTLDIIIKKAIRSEILSLYSLKKTEEQVDKDCRRAIGNITEWIAMMLNPRKNQHNVKFEKFCAAEQEYNTDTYGIKGNIDGTIMIRDHRG